MKSCTNRSQYSQENHFISLLVQLEIIIEYKLTKLLRQKVLAITIQSCLISLSSVLLVWKELIGETPVSVVMKFKRLSSLNTLQLKHWLEKLHNKLIQRILTYLIHKLLCNILLKFSELSFKSNLSAKNKNTSETTKIPQTQGTLKKVFHLSTGH